MPITIPKHKNKSIVTVKKNIKASFDNHSIYTMNLDSCNIVCFNYCAESYSNCFRRLASNKIFLKIEAIKSVMATFSTSQEDIVLPEANINAPIHMENNQDFEKLTVLEECPEDPSDRSNTSKLNPLSKTIKKLTPNKTNKPATKKKTRDLSDNLNVSIIGQSIAGDHENEDKSTTIDDNDTILFGKNSTEKEETKKDPSNTETFQLSYNENQDGTNQADDGLQEDHLDKNLDKKESLQLTNSSYSTEPNDESGNNNIKNTPVMLKSNNDIISKCNFDIKRVWFDYGRKDILFEVCLDKEDDEKRSIISRRELAKKDQPLLLSFYEKCLDYSSCPNAAGFKLKEPSFMNSFPSK